jgi:hypothetical protein
MRKTIFGLLTLLSAMINIATAIAVPLAYVLHKYVIKVGEIQFSLLEWGLLAAIGYAVMNVLSGKIDQDDTKLYWLDTASSWLAALSINLSAGHVLLGLYKEKQNVVEIMQQDMALLLLMGLVAFSWLDLLWLQRKKTAMLASSAVSPAACAKPDLQVYKDLHKEPPSSAVTWSGGFMAAVIIVLLIGGTFYATNTVDLTSPSKPVAVQSAPAPVAPQAAVPPKQEEPAPTVPAAPQLAPTPAPTIIPPAPQKGLTAEELAQLNALRLKRAAAILPPPEGGQVGTMTETTKVGMPPSPNCHVPDGPPKHDATLGGTVQRWKRVC